jgi:hypothetical protein
MGTLHGPLDGMTLSCDWLVNFETLYGQKSQVSAGFEWLLAESVPVRAGWWWDELTGEQRVSAGLGVVVPYFAVDVSLQQSVDVSLQGFAVRDRRVLSFALKGFLPI